jgi:RNA polymerase-binding transcription factor DksA
MMRDDATELRIAIGRVLEQWQTDVIAAEQHPDRAELTAAHIADIKRALSAAVRDDRSLGGQRWLGTATRPAARELAAEAAAAVARIEHRRGCMCARCETEAIGCALLNAARGGAR